MPTKAKMIRVILEKQEMHVRDGDINEYDGLWTMGDLARMRDSQVRKLWKELKG